VLEAGLNASRQSFRGIFRKTQSSVEVRSNRRRFFELARTSNPIQGRVQRVAVTDGTKVRSSKSKGFSPQGS
jgi:hypothetical protein